MKDINLRTKIEAIYKFHYGKILNLCKTSFNPINKGKIYITNLIKISISYAYIIYINHIYVTEYEFFLTKIVFWSYQNSDTKIWSKEIKSITKGRKIKSRFLFEKNSNTRWQHSYIKKIKKIYMYVHVYICI